MKKSHKILLWAIGLIALVAIPFIYFSIKKKGVQDEIPNFGSDQTRGVRNKNPLNLRKTDETWKHKVTGSDPDFETFETMMWGVRAGLRNMRTHFNRGKNTIEKIIHTWAPPEDHNDTESYINYVSQKAGIARDKELIWDMNYFYPIIAAMCQIESKYFLKYDLYEKAWGHI